VVDDGCLVLDELTVDTTFYNIRKLYSVKLVNYS
jgi:hypothetical protein